MPNENIKTKWKIYENSTKSYYSILTMVEASCSMLKKLPIQFHIYITFEKVTSTTTDLHYMKAMQKKCKLFIYPFCDILTTTTICHFLKQKVK